MVLFTGAIFGAVPGIVCGMVLGVLKPQEFNASLRQILLAAADKDEAFFEEKLLTIPKRET